MPRDFEEQQRRAREKMDGAWKECEVGKCGAALDCKVFEPIVWVVHGYLPEGLALLAGRPKLGKSWLALEWALRCVLGDVAMGEADCKKGDVLYLALEDNERRLQSRIRKLIGKGRCSPRFRYMTEILPTDGKVELIVRRFLETAEKPVLVVIDTVGKVKAANSGKDIYQEDYAFWKGLHDLAKQHHCAILGVTHTRKSEADDPMDTIMGSTGVSAAPDTLLVLKKDPATGQHVLHVRGRDAPEREVSVSFDKESCLWRVQGEAATVRAQTFKSDKRREIIELLGEEGPMTPAGIARELRMNRQTARSLLKRMLGDGELHKAGDNYAVPPAAGTTGGATGATGATGE